jgi:hypothetical protein
MVKSEYQIRCQKCWSRYGYNYPGPFLADLVILDEHPHQHLIDRGVTPRYGALGPIEDQFYALYLPGSRSGIPNVDSNDWDYDMGNRMNRRYVYWAPGSSPPIDGARVLEDTFQATCPNDHTIDASRDRIRRAVATAGSQSNLHL